MFGANGARSSASWSPRSKHACAPSIRAARRPEQLRSDKERAFETLRGEYETLKAGSWQGNADYDAWFAQPLNNATLASVATYTNWLPALRGRLRAVGLTAFYADAAAVAKLDVEERAARLRDWDAQASTAGATSAVR